MDSGQMVDLVEEVMGRVLVVDDDEDWCELLATVLRSRGLAVSTAADGEQALAVLAADTFDVVVTDLAMPWLDGKELLAHVRATCPTVDVLVLSAVASIPDVVDTIQLGAKNFVEKRAGPQTVLREVEALLRLRQISPPALDPRFVVEVPPDFDADGFEIDTDLEIRVLDAPLEADGCFGRYELLRVLGSGSMGTVFRARDPLLRRDVALKVMRLVGFEESAHEEMKARFEREGWIGGNLAHPNIAAVYDFGFELEARQLYMVMEYVEGTPLQSKLRTDGPLPLERAMQITVQIAVALEFAHRRSVVHRDVKPANLMLCPDGHVKLLDFGVAHVPASDLTGEHRLVGTPSYASPEAVFCHDLDFRTDQFSLGVVLFEMLTGKSPFKASNLVATANNIVTMPTPRLEDYGVSVPLVLQSILDRLLAKDPDDRYFDEVEMVDDLRSVLTIVEQRAASRPASWVDSLSAPFAHAS